MLDAFRLGGWGMYPTLIAGIFLMVSAFQYARRPEAVRLRVLRFLGVLVILTSTLGFVTGVIKTCTHVTPELGSDLGMFVVIGVGESLTNIGAGLVWLVMATIVATFGASRSRATDAALTDPHAP
ncbi:MAG: hypothetical protein ACKV2T_13550 [Kofleriaceae bacterium]